jgi:hypothetical protein
VDQLPHAVLLAGVDHVLSADHGAALALGRVALHRGAAVDDDLGAGDRAVDCRGVAEVAEAVLDAVLGEVGDPALEHADAVAVEQGITITLRQLRPR